MKKLAVLFVCVALLASCDGFKGGSKDLKAENDSLLMELNQRNAELDDMLGTGRVFSDGSTLQINTAFGSIDLTETFLNFIESPHHIIQFSKVSVRSMLPKAVLTCSVEPSLKTLPVPSNRLLLTSNSSPSKWKKTKRRLQSYRHS